MSNSHSNNKALKVAEDEYEMYAQVTKMLGNGMCYVLCMDSKTRLCYIRGKFRGRGKRDNFIGLGSWILVGLRDFETVKEGSQENCDLMEVYTDAEKEKLRSTVHENWNLFSTSEKNNTEVYSEFDFIDDKTDEYMKLMEEEITNTTKSDTKSSSNILVFDTGEEIDIDDI